MDDTELGLVEWMEAQKYIISDYEYTKIASLSKKQRSYINKQRELKSKKGK